MSLHRRPPNRDGLAIAVGLGLGLGIAGAAAALAVGVLNINKRKRPPPLTCSQWQAALDSSGRLENLPEVLEQGMEGGCEPSIRAEVWPYLLRVYSPTSTIEQRAALRAGLEKRYTDLLQKCQDLETSLERSVVRTGSGVSVAENAGTERSIPAHLAQFAEAQRIIVLDAIRTDLLQPDHLLRCEQSNTHMGPSNGSHWSSVPWTSRVAEETLAGATHLTAASKRQAARLINLLLAYATHDPETGYCQGMSDLAAPFLSVFDDDSMAFWCFERLMQKTRRNFRHDETGIRDQLRTLGNLLEKSDPVLFHRLRQIGAGECFFAYRMIIVLLRREMTLQQTVCLWEIMWADDYWQRLGTWSSITPLARPHAPPVRRASGNQLLSASTAPLGMAAAEEPASSQPDLLLYCIAGIFWKAVTRRDDDEEVQVADPRFEESQRPGRYPCIEHELASFRGGDSDEIDLPGSSEAASSQAPVPAPSSAADADTSDTPLGQPSRLVSDADESGPVQRSGTEESEQPIASPSSDQLSSSAWGVTSESSHRRTDSSSSNVSKALATPTHQHQRLPSFPEIDYEPGSDPANEDHKRTPSFPTIDYEPATASDSVFVQMHPFPENAVFSEGASLSENELGMSRVPSSSSKRRGRPKPLQTTITASSKQLQEATEEVSTPVNRLMAAASRSWSEPNLAGRDQPANLLEGQPAFYGTIHADFRQGVGYADSEASEEASPPPKGSRREVNGSIAAERAASLKRTRADTDAEVPQALKLDVLSGPRQDLSYTTQLGTTQVTIGRLDGNTLVIKDNEVSGNHTLIRWDAKERCWEVTDVGSLNGTVLNGRTISTSNRRRGRNYRLSSDDILQLGSATRIKVSYCPVELPLNDLPLPPKRLHTPSSIWQNVTALDGSAASTGAPEEPASHAAPAPPAAMPSRPPTHPPAATSFQQASLRLSGCVVSKTGREHQRKGQGCEDVPFWQCPVPGTTNVGLFCVFDGHCGRATAEEVRDILPKQLAERLPSVTADMAAGRGADSIWEDTFLTTDAALTSEEGCTATALLAWQDAGGQVCLQTANVGDSAGVFSDLQQQRCFQMTADHRLTNPVERQRLKDMGINMGSGRTRLYGLNLSRCLGDKFLKDEDLGLSAQPHVSQVVKVGSSETAFVMLASDGLWDVTDSQHAVQVALRAHQESDGSVQAMAEAVVQHAQRQRTKDDVTVLLVKIGAAVEAASSGQGALKPHE
ncbi:hypothetical protein WJX72_004520 [[Myrmecia] bisecta]|uniref:Uncharacterized protein n=1 Tax=[Myrmecia] bisecta TaxID=41462 RepID=A0AAW1R654_9CHLO